MIREVDLVSYMPKFMQSYNEPVEALKAENPEFAIMWKAVDRVFCNRFILTADEYGISRFEKILGIYPMKTESLEARRLRVQNRWFNRIPYTLRMFILKLSDCLGKECDFDIYMDFENAYEMTIQIYSSNISSAEEVKYLINVMIPMNMVINLIYKYELRIATVNTRAMSYLAVLESLRIKAFLKSQISATAQSHAAAYLTRTEKIKIKAAQNDRCV